MKTGVYQLAFDGAILERGFWLYVCQISAPDGRTVHYVGKTGDKASRVCQSPFNRLSNHFSVNTHSNALKRHLSQNKIDPELCRFQFHTYGPLFQSDSKATHGELCDITSALEKGLSEAMVAAGYTVINTVQCRKQVNARDIADVLAAFASHFSKLKEGPVSVKDQP